MANNSLLWFCQASVCRLQIGVKAIIKLYIFHDFTKYFTSTPYTIYLKFSALTDKRTSNLESYIALHKCTIFQKILALFNVWGCIQKVNCKVQNSIFWRKKKISDSVFALKSEALASTIISFKAYQDISSFCSWELNCGIAHEVL